MRRDRILTFIALAALLAYGIWLYSPMTKLYFINDDWWWLTNSFLSRDNLGHVFVSWTGYFRPLSQLAFYLIYRFFGLNTQPFYSVALSLQLIDCLIVYWLATVILNKKIPSLIVASSYLAAFSSIQAVTYLSELEGLFSTGLVLLSLGLFIRALRSNRSADLYWSLLAFVVALGFKDASIILVLLVASYAVLLPAEKGLKRSLVLVSPYVVIGLSFFLFLARRVPPGADSSPFYVALHAQHYIAAITIAFHTWLINLSTIVVTFFPVSKTLPNLFVQQGLASRPIATQFVPAEWFMAIVSLLGLFLWWRKAKLSQTFFWLLIWAGAALLPYVVIWPITGYDGSRYFALTTIGICIGLGAAYQALVEMTRSNRLVAILLLIPIVWLFGVNSYWVRAQIAELDLRSQSSRSTLVELKRGMPTFQAPVVMAVDSGDLALNELNNVTAMVYPINRPVTAKTEALITLLNRELALKPIESALLQKTGRLALLGPIRDKTIVRLVKDGKLSADEVIYLHYADGHVNPIAVPINTVVAMPSPMP